MEYTFPIALQLTDLPYYEYSVHDSMLNHANKLYQIEESSLCFITINTKMWELYIIFVVNVKVFFNSKYKDTAFMHSSIDMLAYLFFIT